MFLSKYFSRYREQDNPVAAPIIVKLLRVLTEVLHTVRIKGHTKHNMSVPLGVFMEGITLALGRRELGDS